MYCVYPDEITEYNYYYYDKDYTSRVLPVEVVSVTFNVDFVFLVMDFSVNSDLTIADVIFEYEVSLNKALLCLVLVSGDSANGDSLNEVELVFTLVYTDKDFSNWWVNHK